MTLPARADVVVVGGGITGTALASELAGRGAAVVLFERHRIAAGPTGRSTALVRVHYSQPLLVRMAAYGLERYRRFEETTGASAGFVQTGVLWVVGPEDLAALRANVDLVRAEVGEVELLEPEALARIEPRLSVAGVAGACWEPGSGYCDPYLAAAGFADAAGRHGADIVEGAPVEAVEPGCVHAGGRSVAAGHIVVAAGAWSAPLLAPLGYEFPVVAARAQVGRFRMPAGFGPPPPALADLGELQFYVKGSEGDYLEVGTLDPSHGADPIDPDRCPEGAEADVLAAFRRSLVTRFPGLAGGHWRGAWSGVYDVTPDWQPALGAVPDVDGVYLAAGFSGHGFKLAPAVAVALADLIDGGGRQRFDVGLLDPGRFAGGELVPSRYGYSVVG